MSCTASRAGRFAGHEGGVRTLACASICAVFPSRCDERIEMFVERDGDAPKLVTAFPIKQR